MVVSANTETRGGHSFCSHRRAKCSRPRHSVKRGICLRLAIPDALEAVHLLPSQPQQNKNAHSGIFAFGDCGAGNRTRNLKVMHATMTFVTNHRTILWSGLCLHPSAIGGLGARRLVSTPSRLIGGLGSALPPSRLHRI